jgi:tRNA threonylcarbamoyladenosine biosynthesis protein TsaB
MNVLAIETSAARGSVAWRSGGELRLVERFDAGRGQAGLFGALLALRPHLEPCDRIAVGIGPGGYSGMRVGAAAALGLREALGGELVGIPSVLAYGPGRYAVAGDARRGEGFFLKIEGRRIVEGPVLLPMDRLGEGLVGWRVVGPSALEAVPGMEVCFPDAADLAELAEEGIGIVQRGVISPLYIREPAITAPKQRPGLRKG